MRFAIISDTHFGDPMATLVAKNNKGNLIAGPKYKDFKEAAGQNNDYLVLLGDIFDFSIASYAEAYGIAGRFFRQIKRDNIAKEIIFVPGNHDFDLWHTVEHEINVIYQVTKGRTPTAFRMSVPGVIDDREDSAHRGFTLPGVSAKTRARGPKYAGLFLDSITGVNNRTIFNFAYPNVYLVTEKESVLLTHGHYLEMYWALAGEWAMKIASEDLRVGNVLSLKEMVAINFPLSQLACSGVGQAGPLTKVVRQVQRDAKDGKLDKIEKYLDRADNEIDKLTRHPWYKQYLEWLTDIASDKIKKMILKSIDSMGETRYSEEFIHKEEVLGRFKNFFRASLIEIDQLNHQLEVENRYNIPPPKYIIFGHTHQPIPWGAEDAPKTLAGDSMQPVFLFNTGGWLNRHGAGDKVEFCGAEVFTYTTDEGLKSISIK